MGLVKAVVNAASSTFNDGFKDYFYCEALPSDVLMSKGHKRNRQNLLSEDNNIITTWTADVHIDACRHTIKWRYSSHRDHFRKDLQKAGFDMSHWTLTKRSKTPFKEFLSSICSNYKDYHLINLIEIG